MLIVAVHHCPAINKDAQLQAIFHHMQKLFQNNSVFFYIYHVDTSSESFVL